MAGSKENILICDDEDLIRWSISEHLKKEGYSVQTAHDGQAGLEAIDAEPPDLLVLDLNMPRIDGLSVLAKMHESEVDIPVIVLTAHGAIDTALEATKLGAREYLSKPFDLKDLTHTIAKTLRAFRLENEVSYLRSQSKPAYGQIIGESRSMHKVFSLLEKLENIDGPTVLLLGDSGTGKDLVARSIHEKGVRKDGPFMEVDCASLPDQLIESELFGHERGAFTDAKSTKPGLFELARGGTIFLDEIGEMTIGTQSKLLRALENRRFKRVGGTRSIELCASVITATNSNLLQDVKEGRFREDLYFRLNVISITMPKLSDRTGDIPHLAKLFVANYNKRFRRNVSGISEAALKKLERYPWPGNVRELRNVIERAVILNTSEIITVNDLPEVVRSTRNRLSAHPTGGIELPEEGINLDDLEISLLTQAMARTKGNQSAASRLLGLTRYTLRYRLEKHGLSEKPEDAT
jgi:two-component system, NtrC family, response regulator AtoC